MSATSALSSARPTVFAPVLQRPAAHGMLHNAATAFASSSPLILAALTPTHRITPRPVRTRRHLRAAVIPRPRESGMAVCQRSRLACQAASGGDSQEKATEAKKKKPAGGLTAVEDGGEAGGGAGGLLGAATTAGIFGLWAALLAYAFLQAPAQTPYRDQYFLEKLLSLRADDGFAMNQVLVSLWNLMGVLPGVYAATLVPAARTDRSKVPAWPFLVLSFFAGAFAMIPFFALWSPGKATVPTEEERGKVGMKIVESKIAAGLLFVAALGLVGSAVAAPSSDWMEMLQYFQESKLVHVTSMDFILLNMFLPFWLINDMGYRSWEPRDSWGAALPFIPLIGPTLYLVLRPGLPAAPPVDSSQVKGS